MSKTTEIRQQTFTAPAAASATNMLNAHAIDGTTQTPVVQPDMARVLQLVGDSGATAVVPLSGTDFSGNAISENVTLNSTTPVLTVNAYASLNPVVLPTQASKHVSIGYAAPLGLDSCCDANSFCITNSTETSYIYNPTILAKNTITINGTLNASNNFAVAYIPSTFPTGRIWG